MAGSAWVQRRPFAQMMNVFVDTNDSCGNLTLALKTVQFHFEHGVEPIKVCERDPSPDAASHAHQASKSKPHMLHPILSWIGKSLAAGLEISPLPAFCAIIQRYYVANGKSPQQPLVQRTNSSLESLLMILKDVVCMKIKWT